MKELRFFTIFNITPGNEQEANGLILYKLNEVTKAADITLLTIAPVIENFTKEYTEEDIIQIAESTGTGTTGGEKKFGYFTDNVFREDIAIRELDFTNIEQFIFYIQQNNIQIVKWFIEAEIDINKVDEYGNYPIMYVKDFYILKMLIMHNAKINSIHIHNIEKTEQPIYYYIISNFDFSLYIVKYLLKHGLNVKLLDSNHENFLYRTNEYEIHRLFVKHGLEMDDKMIKYYYTNAPLFKNFGRFLALT